MISPGLYWRTFRRAHTNRGGEDGASAQAHTVDEVQRSRNRTELTAISDRVRTAPSGETRTTGSRHRDRVTGRGVRSDRVARCLRGSGEDGDLQGRSGNRSGQRGNRTGCRPSGRHTAAAQWCRTERPGNTPTEPWTDRSALAPILMARVTGSAWNGDKSGAVRLAGRHPKTGIARHTALPISVGGNGETGDVNRSRGRLTPDERPVVDLSI